MSARARTVADVLVVLALAAYAIPFFWQLLTSFKPEAELLRVPPLLPSRLTFSHYSVVFTKSLMPQALVNSLGIATLTTLVSLLAGVPAAYAVARLPLPGKRLLLLAIVALLIKFTKQLGALGMNMLTISSDQMIIDILTLVDSALIAALLLIIGFSGYENFVSKIGTGEHEDRPAWMGRVGFSDLKIKLMGAIVAISAVELLKAFINVNEATPWQTLAWKVGIHVTFVVSGVLFAVTDWITERRGNH